MNLTLREISEATGGSLTGDPERVVKSYHIDSRKFIPRSDSFFIALRGERNDGHDFIVELASRGINSFMVEEIPPGLPPFLNFILVKDCFAGLHLLASCIRGKYNGQVIGITGSNGKTILKEWLYLSLSRKEKIFRSPESYNSQVGVPLSLFMLDSSTSMALIEAGISKPGEMEKLERIIRPEMGILTNIGTAHQENFLKEEDKLEEKLKLFRNSKRLIYCSNYKNIQPAIRKFLPAIESISWGSASESDYQINHEIQKEGTTLLVEKHFRASFRLKFLDHASIENASHLVVFLLEFGYETSEIQLLLDQLEPVAMRMEIIKATGNSTLINDSYNSDLVSLENALDYLSGQDQHKKKTLILSDILQSGKNQVELVEIILKMITNRKVDKFIGIGSNFKQYSGELPENSYIYGETDDFILDLRNHSFLDEAILLKGSRKYEFERISAFLQEKTHRTIMEINLNALVENYRLYRSLLPPGTGIMAMVKAFSYGSGGYEVASVLQYNKVEYLTVAYADEGVDLRKNGIHIPIMVMNPEERDFHFLIRYRLEPEIYSKRILDQFRNYLKRNAISSWPIHIKLDTGMHRLGFCENELENLINDILEKDLQLVSVFSHLAAADNPEFDDFTHRQISLFQKMCGRIKERTGQNFMRHILNTPGIERFPEACFEMVRPGIGLYGISEHFQARLKEVSSFKTSISQVKELDENETVGYNRAGKIKGIQLIGTLPVGYADGIPRALGNGIGKFKVNGHIVPVIGNVCMDMTMVNLTGTGAREGDEVLIFGDGFSVRQLADAIGTISYEILTGISQRVKRVYYIE